MNPYGTLESPALRWAAAADARVSLDSIELDAYFVDCDRREPGVEPDWERHLEVIERSRGVETAPT